MNKALQANEQQVLMLKDQSDFISRVLEWLLKNRVGNIHSNRTIDTGWKSMKFEFTVSDEVFTRGILVRLIRTKADLLRLENLLKEVSELVSSGITDNSIIFSLELFINVQETELNGSIRTLVKRYSFVEHVHFI